MTNFSKFIYIPLCGVTHSKKLLPNLVVTICSALHEVMTSRAAPHSFLATRAQARNDEKTSLLVAPTARPLFGQADKRAPLQCGQKHLTRKGGRLSPGAIFNGAQNLPTLISTYVPTSKNCCKLVLIYSRVRRFMRGAQICAPLNPAPGEVQVLTNRAARTGA